MATLTPAAEPASRLVQPLFPFLDLAAQFETIRAEVMAAIAKTMDSQKFILGQEVQNFEHAIAKYVGCKFAVGCASGSDALLLALMALDIGPGDEVITTPFTFVATAGSIARTGAKPVYVDIDPQTYNIDVAQLARAVTPRTRAILPVHLYGLAADMDAIMALARQHNLAVIEDAAQALGAEYRGKKLGGLGTVGCFSFFPSKNLGGSGDGGMLTTNDPDLAERLRLLRVHGSRRKYHCEVLGMNSRLDALQAAILGVKLPYLDTWAEGRRRNSSIYRSLMSNLAERLATPVEPDGCKHVYNQFVVRVADRDALRAHLLNCGIPTEIYYPEPLHLQPAFSYLGYRDGDFPHAETASAQVLALPIFPELTETQQRAVVEAITEFHRLA